MRDGFDGFLDLGIGFEKDFETFLSAESGHEDFLLDFALDPIEIIGPFRVRCSGCCAWRGNRGNPSGPVIHFKVVSDVGLGAEIKLGEAADALFDGIEDVVAIQVSWNLVGLGVSTRMSGVMPPPPVTWRPLSVWRISVGCSGTLRS